MTRERRGKREREEDLVFLLDAEDHDGDLLTVSPARATTRRRINNKFRFKKTQRAARGEGE